MLDHILTKMIVYSGILMALVFVTHELIHPLEQAFLSPAMAGGILFYLPLGFWVLVAYYERWLAALLVAPGLAVGLAIYGSPDLPLVVRLLQLVVMAGTAPAVFAMLAWASGRPNEPLFEPHAWRMIVTAGAITAVFNALGLTVLRHASLAEVVSVEAVLRFSLGGIIGLLSCLALLSLAFRIRRLGQTDH